SMFKQVKILQMRMSKSSMSLEDPELRPTREFISSGTANSLETHCDTKSIDEWTKFVVPQFNSSDDLWKPAMAAVEEHIGNAKTRCFSCELIFANAADYYEHLCSSYHLREKKKLNLITLVVNMQRGHQINY
ncbi:hypothetical protein PMAYCL1PPCAC_01269, partial [Pristionchus mayeri]